MSQKSLIWLGMFIGSTVGGFIPSFWDAGMFSMSGLLLSGVGGLLGIWIGYKIGQQIF